MFQNTPKYSKTYDFVEEYSKKMKSDMQILPDRSEGDELMSRE